MPKQGKLYRGECNPDRKLRGQNDKSFKHKEEENE